MKYQPNTTIWFCHTGITGNNKIVCRTQEELVSVITKEGNVLGRMTDCSFQRNANYFYVRADHENIPYYTLLQCDTVFYKNEERAGAFWIVGNITQVEWKNEDCSYVHFVIDAFMTYQAFIDWDKTYAYVMREHVKEDWSASGNPMFSNIGPAENFSVKPDTPIFYWSKSYKFNNVLVQSPYNNAGEAQFDGTIKNGMYSSMQSLIGNAGGVNDFFNTIAEAKEASINNIVDVRAMPDEFVGAVDGNLPDFETDLTCVNVVGKANPNVPDYNNAKCWSSPFVTIRLMASNGSFMDFTPQWFGNDIDDYHLMIRGRFVGGQFGGIAATFKNKNGIFNWKAWNDFIVSIDELPRCYWTADGFTDWATIMTAPLIMRQIVSGFNLISGANSAANASESLNPVANQGRGEFDSGMALVGAGLDFVSQAVETMAAIQQQKSTGAAVNGGGSYNGLFDIGQDAWGFKVVYYMAQPYLMLPIDSYFDRFGYRVNKLKKLETENRPIWTFVQTAECHVAATTGIPIIYENQINNLFNSGCTFWTKDKYLAGRKIGDFSNPAENKGIKGA